LCDLKYIVVSSYVACKQKYTACKFFNDKPRSFTTLSKPPANDQEAEDCHSFNCQNFRVVRQYEEEFEDTKGDMRIRKSRKDRQHNGQKKGDKKTNNDLHKTLHIKLRTKCNDIMNPDIQLTIFLHKTFCQLLMPSLLIIIKPYKCNSITNQQQQ